MLKAEPALQIWSDVNKEKKKKKNVESLRHLEDKFLVKISKDGAWKCMPNYEIWAVRLWHLCVEHISYKMEWGNSLYGCVLFNHDFLYGKYLVFH